MVAAREMNPFKSTCERCRQPHCAMLTSVGVTGWALLCDRCYWLVPSVARRLSEPKFPIDAWPTPPDRNLSLASAIAIENDRRAAL